MIRFIKVASPIGTLRVYADDKGLISLDFPRDAKKARAGTSEDRKSLRTAETALRDYFAKGKPLPRLPKGARGGTEFQRKVWAAIEAIPFGQTRGYGEIAEQIGHPGAARAVGAACGANPLPLFVPCHRVLAANGRIGGFSGGLDVKRKLLRLENAL